ncbi:MAG TPA: MarR family winged helix-turn-helix transcriptional regulator [Ktedonobacterales bacterium]|nr:MarR family winged helix-turn-helix transcriptional regulator [Ktedonobacterales bacterium]
MEFIPEGSPSVHAVMEAMWRVNHARLRSHTPEWVHLDLSIGQLKTLMVLASHPRMSVGMVAETLEVGKPAASMLVDRLVHLGFAQRTEDREDRRRTWVEATAAGTELVARLRQGGSERLSHALELMEPEDRDALLRGLQALAAIAEREAALTNGALPTKRD